MFTAPMFLNPKSILLRAAIPLIGWALVFFGAVLVVVGNFPTPPPNHPMIDFARPSALLFSETLLFMLISIFGLVIVIWSKKVEKQVQDFSRIWDNDFRDNSWKVLDSYPDETTAESIVEILRNNGVAARVDVDSSIPGLVNGIRIQVIENHFQSAMQIINRLR